MEYCKWSSCKKLCGHLENMLLNEKLRSRTMILYATVFQRKNVYKYPQILLYSICIDPKTNRNGFSKERNGVEGMEPRLLNILCFMDCVFFY